MKQLANMRELARNAAAANAFSLMRSNDGGAGFVERMRQQPNETLDRIGELSGIPAHQLHMHRALIRGEKNEFTEGLRLVDGLLQPGDIILMTANQPLANAQKTLYKNAKSSHVALIHADFICIDAIPKTGVSNRIVSEVLAGTEPGWRVIRHRSVGQHLSDPIMRACAFYIAQPYLICPAKKAVKNFTYCSELARKIYKDIGVQKSGIPNHIIVAPAHFDRLADEHPEWINVTEIVRPAIEFCQRYPELVKLSTALFTQGLLLNRQRFKERTQKLTEIQRLAKTGKITREQAKAATAEIREIERNMNNTFWDVKRQA